MKTRLDQSYVTGILLVALVAGPTFSLAAGETAPSCVDLHDPKPESKYAFAEASMIALSYAQAVSQETKAFEAEREATSDPQTLLIALMRTTKTASEEYACAERVVQPYKKSRERDIGIAASYLAAIYDQHKTLTDQFVELLRRLPDAAKQPTKFADIVSTMEVERGKLWNDLRRATILTLLGLVDQGKPDGDGKLRTLVITRAERKALLDRLLQSFPNVKDQADKPGSPELIFLAGLYYRLLTNPYKCSDE